MTDSTREEDSPEAKQIEENIAFIQQKLNAWAMHWAARYNGTVYLTGSTLHSPTPRDCDIRIVMYDHEFAARYGMALEHMDVPEHHPLSQKRGVVSMQAVKFHTTGPSQRWVDDMAKFNGIVSTQLKLNMDIQAWPESTWLDTYPDPIVLARTSPRWWFYNKHHPDRRPLLLKNEQADGAGDSET